DKVAVEVEVPGRKDYIYVEENGEQQNYEEDLLLPAADLEAAKKIQHYVEAAIRQCPTDITATDWSWIEKEIAAGAVTEADVNQSVEQMEGNPCKWAVEIIESGKKTQEDRYEFNLYDINPEKIDLQISGKRVLIRMETNDRAEIIQRYSNSEDLGYERDLSFEVKDVATAKILVATMKELMEGCEEE
ncbi:MAG: hypothetical protein GYB31_21045, partial [Bacteroidetes bacterium]|nr:hypothetical protein [Bacteroidota bacterium]